MSRLFVVLFSANHPFACGLCKTCYGRKSALLKHLRSHKKSEVRCSVCRKEFHEQSRLDIHMLTHTGQRPYQCEVCGNRYTSSLFVILGQGNLKNSGEQSRAILALLLHGVF